MNPVKTLLAWFRKPAADDPETAAEAQRLRDDRETIRGSQTMVGQMGPGIANVTPTPDVLHPERDR
jgi:hypothetical protein